MKKTARFRAVRNKVFHVCLSIIPLIGIYFYFGCAYGKFRRSTETDQKEKENKRKNCALDPFVV
jgi:hypothetical protein